jgi:hypothetical protein
MRWPHSKTVRFLGLLFLFILFSGCASGPRYADVSNSLPPIGTDVARIILLREAHLIGAPLSPRVKIDGQKVGELPNGSVLIVEHAPGELTISIDLAIERGALEFPLRAELGQEYYVEVGLDEPTGYYKASTGLVGALMDNFRGEGVTQFCSVGWCAQVRARSEALAKMADLRVQPSEGNAPPYLATEERR